MVPAQIRWMHLSFFTWESRERNFLRSFSAPFWGGQDWGRQMHAHYGIVLRNLIIVIMHYCTPSSLSLTKVCQLEFIRDLFNLVTLLVTFPDWSSPVLWCSQYLDIGRIPRSRNGCWSNPTSLPSSWSYSSDFSICLISINGYGVWRL